MRNILKRFKETYTPEIKKGKTRIVFTFSKLGFVIKFPIIKLWPIYSFIPDLIKYGWKNATIQWRMSTDDNMSFRKELLGGIVANLQERKAWKAIHHKLLCPTWFSFLGLLNVQEYRKPLEGVNGLWIAIRIDTVTNNESHKVGHGFEITQNYCEKDGRLMMIDYGNRRLCSVIKKYGEEISRITIEECKIDPFPDS